MTFSEYVETLLKTKLFGKTEQNLELPCLKLLAPIMVLVNQLSGLGCVDVEIVMSKGIFQKEP